MKSFITRTRIVIALLVVTGSLGALAFSKLGDSLVYYRTPSEVQAKPSLSSAGRFRVGGMVQPGTVKGDGKDVHFVLTDGAAEVSVLYHGTPPGVFQEGEGAIVEGNLGTDGVFRSDYLLVKHSNEYRRSDGKTFDPESAGASSEFP